MFQIITLFKLVPESCTDAVRVAAAGSLRDRCRTAGFDAVVGLPADDAALKSWDLSLVVSFRTREQATTFDAAELVSSATGLAREAFVVIKGWNFDASAPLS